MSSSTAERVRVREFLTFTIIGAVNTILYLLLYNVFRASGLGPFSANGIAVAISITFSFWANSKFTFRVVHGNQRMRRYLEFSGVFVSTLILSNTALWVLFRVVEKPTSLQENAALVIAGGALVVVRFFVMRAWVFNPERAARVDAKP